MRRKKRQEEHCITIESYGTKLDYFPQNEEEKQMMEQAGKLLKRREQNGPVTIEDALRTTQQVGLGEKVAAAFQKETKRKMIRNVVGLGIYVGYHLFLDSHELPSAIEIVGYIGAISGELQYGMRCLTTPLANNYVRRHLT